ncbi:tRNA pseudouridine(38-40) synthase TruA [Candidatus Omnitrophota bacterium]
MRNLKITIEYDGTNYAGWQIQKRHKKKTIQQTIEQALAKILQENVKLVGSGRTDAGTHALGQVANFKTNSKLKLNNISRGLNSILPVDIRIKSICNAPLDFHARFSARSKHYRYTIVNQPFLSPQLRHFSYLVKCPLDIEKIKRAAVYLLGRHNLRSFQAVDKVNRDAVRTIQSLKVSRKGKAIQFDIAADGFLYKMVRNIVGTLIEVGRGKIKPEDIPRILAAKSRVDAGPCAPAKGLCLIRVKY